MIYVQLSCVINYHLNGCRILNPTDVCNICFYRKKYHLPGKKVLHKSAEATREMIGNKVADRITKSSRNKAQKEDDRIMEETQEILIPPEKREQIIRDLKLF